MYYIFGQGDEETYKSGVYRGPKTSVMGEDPLAGELMNSKSDSTEETDENIVRYVHAC